MGISDLIDDLLFGKITTLEEAKQALKKQNLDETLLDNTANEAISNDRKLDSNNPYASPGISIPDNPTTYVRSFKIQKLSSGDTLISGRIVIEDPAAYKRNGIWIPEVIASIPFKKAA